MTDLFVVWTPASIAAALVGGGLLGLLVVSRFDNPRFDAIESMAVVATIGVVAGVTFFGAQAVEAAFSDGPTFAWRVISRALLFGLFVLAMAGGTGIAVRHERGGWRLL